MNDKSPITRESYEETYHALRLLGRSAKDVCKKLRVKLHKQQDELGESDKWMKYKEIGDSLLAVANEIKKGNTEWELQNIHSLQHEKIVLNPKHDAVRNAEIYYRRAKKSKRSIEICHQKVRETKESIHSMERTIDAIDNCMVLEAYSEEFKIKAMALLTEHSDELMHTGHHKKNTRPGNVPHVSFRHFTIEGWDVYIGKNTSQNDELSTRFAKPGDIWFHVAAHAGSHVIIRREKNSPWPPQEVCKKTAALAVWFSKVKHTSFAEVHITEARFVHKRHKAPPGEVVLDRYKTLRVAPCSPQELFKSDYS